MAERILVPLDGSPLGEAALEYVKTFISNLASEKKTTIVLFHVITDLTREIGKLGMELSELTPIPYSEEEMEGFKKQRLEYLERISEPLKKGGSKIEKAVVTGGNPAEEILKAEKEFGCDLVAMSTHGRTGFSRWAFGSVTDKVLRHGTVPVLMVRAEKKG